MPTVSWNRRWGKQIEEHVESGQDFMWGYQWGDPEQLPTLSAVIARYISPYVLPEMVVMEIGPGGGRWTQFLTRARELVLVDLNPEFFGYLRDRFSQTGCELRFYSTRDSELDGVASDSIDFVFSFDVFVHIDPPDIASYLAHISRVLKPGGRAVIQYADKTKKAALENDSFSDMDAGKMEGYARRHFRLEVHDTTLVSHSNIIVLRKPPPGSMPRD